MFQLAVAAARLAPQSLILTARATSDRLVIVNLQYRDVFSENCSFVAPLAAEYFVNSQAPQIITEPAGVS